MRQRNNRKTLVLITIAGLAIGLIGWNTVGTAFRSEKNEAYRGVPCVNPALPAPQELHIHPELRIAVRGKNVEFPSNIGLSFNCHRVLHTHDTTGTIHVEPNYKQDFTLGDFFAVWGKPFSRGQALEYRADAAHRIVMTVDGATSDAYGELILKDKQKIEIVYAAANATSSPSGR